ncbi:hypothetical protein HPP92_008099 [Vanilla planifolia]|uniref:Uncharacterized protein n=1 Tax=Vanilla planifolia TaxID=51239 RepID=A0A835R7R6_VANPL|nr:hypothetical protein HPP92_008099 [Vanilla planifolia]
MAPYLIAVAIKRSLAEEFSWSVNPSAEVNIEGIDALQDKLDLRLFDVHFSLAQVASQLGIARVNFGSWSVLKYVEEPDFGPDVPVKILFVLGTLVNVEADFPDSYKWISIESVENLLFGSSPSVGRVGPLAFVGLFHDYYGCRKWKLPKILHGQEYPPGITLVPMRSRTLKPFHCTNLVVVVSEGEAIDNEELDIIKHGDALLVDPGCSSQCHLEAYMVGDKIREYSKKGQNAGKLREPYDTSDSFPQKFQDMILVFMKFDCA